ncbi:TonB family protein [Roseateles chitinivorans]|uniref:TonB family protein n=1 Tax=Roseateles chitinivorans TaxID=2917965 RepID=UPI003D66C50A
MTDGSVGAVEIIDTSGRREFDQAAVMALRSARFNPHLVDGKPVEATVQARFSVPAQKAAPFPR